MDTNQPEGTPGGGPQKQTPVSQVTQVADGDNVVVVEKGATADILSALHAVGGPAAVAAAAKYGANVLNNVVTQRGETRREQLRQDGETTRARIAQQDSQQQPPTQ